MHHLNARWCKIILWISCRRLKHTKGMLKVYWCKIVQMSYDFVYKYVTMTVQVSVGFHLLCLGNMTSDKFFAWKGS